MKRRGRLASGMLSGATLASSLVGCDAATVPPADAGPVAPVASAATSASASASAPPGWPASTLVRRRTPAQAASEDAAACDKGEAAGCRRMAERYRGYGPPAGCGIDRGRPAPTLNRTELDASADERGFLQAIRRACDLGDEEACGIAELAPASFRFSTQTNEAVRMRSAFEGSALYRWQEGIPKTLAEESRKECFKEQTWWGCGTVQQSLYRYEAVKDGSTIPPAIRDKAIAICKATLECADVLMMLDKQGYVEAAVAPVRAEMGEILAEACLDGACTCGEAARMLPATPEAEVRRFDLARAGCDDGEAEGCYELARAIERGGPVPADPKRAMDLYEVACPPVHGSDPGGGALLGAYSPRACDRIAEAYEGGELPPKRPSQALFYAQKACMRSGFERDHAPCLRLARYHATGAHSGRNTEDTLDAARGTVSDPVRRDECNRPSVKEGCKEVDDLLAKRPPGK